ncbi:hypothetical protein SPHINGO391_500008 [Sphingomonas aurantiaca]|uniref:Uncharacterized protein n=1 Tax=Sphingomonas aurantiaca TaxID=185949 RepID=A0A5E8A7T5_9SPHN|nr:hypothetical protein SPHINGO391_500008 [Sphingomonas aurantiaca]
MILPRQGGGSLHAARTKKAARLPGRPFPFRVTMRSLADATATHEVHDREQDDRTQQRHDERGQRQRRVVDGATRQDQTTDECADDANDDVQKYTLLRISAHDHAGNPADDAADDQPKNETHDIFPPLNPYPGDGGKTCEQLFLFRPRFEFWISVLLLALVQRLIVLDPRDAEPGHARSVDRALPAGKFLDGQAIARADVVDAEQPAIDRSDHLGLATNHPARGAGRGQRIQRQLFSERTDDFAGTDFLVLDHL